MLNSTQSAERIHIGFFGLRNVGKSSLVNKITNQEMSIVSSIKGTTTDPVKKSMEILPKRIEKTNRILKTCDIAILVTEANRKLNSIEEELLNNIKIRNIPYIIVKNKMDLLNDKINLNDLDGNSIFISTINNNGIEDLKNKISRVYQKFYNKNNNESEIKFVGNLINK